MAGGPFRPVRRGVSRPANTMYTRYFGLRENPFALPPDPRYLYLSLRHQEALAHLMYGITHGGGFVQLTGEVGTGKTMMIRALLERMPKDIHVALVLYPLLSVEEFVAAICDDLGIARPQNTDGLKSTIDVLNRYLLENHAKGRRTVLIIDEAHKLSHEILEQVRLLTNLETTKEKLLQILLVGQPELVSLLAQPDLRQLAQRISARYNLKALLPPESAEYVMHRLRVAGGKEPIFTRGALTAVHRLSGGIPRLVNTICDRALLGAYARGKNRVNAGMVRQAAEELGQFTPNRYSLRLGAAAAIAIALAVGAWQLSAHWVTPLPKPDDSAVALAPVKPIETAIPIVAPPAPTAEPAETEREAKARLETLFSDPASPTDTDSAFAALFAQWRKDYSRLSGSNGCERAQSVGLRCVYNSGTWNNMRQLNRPAVIELIDAKGQKHQILVSGLKEDRVVLEIGGQKREFPISEVGRYWYGKFLSLWMPPPSGDATLRVGMRGPAVAWLRDALARYSGKPALAAGKELFDAELEILVKDFQRRHFLDDDGIVGRSTLIQLDVYDANVPPPLLTKSATSVETR